MNEEAPSVDWVDLETALRHVDAWRPGESKQQTQSAGAKQASKPGTSRTTAPSDSPGHKEKAAARGSKDVKKASKQGKGKGKGQVGKEKGGQMGKEKEQAGKVREGQTGKKDGEEGANETRKRTATDTKKKKKALPVAEKSTQGNWTRPSESPAQQKLTKKAK